MAHRCETCAAMLVPSGAEFSPAIPSAAMRLRTCGVNGRHLSRKDDAGTAAARRYACPEEEFELSGFPRSFDWKYSPAPSLICSAARRYERLADDPESSLLFPPSWPRSVPELGEPSPSRAAQYSASAIGPPAPTTTGSRQDPDDDAEDEPSPGTESSAWAYPSDSDPIRAKRIPPCASVDVTSAGTSRACCLETRATLFE
mmetsp:Transcript_282/g.618  ORF Transcript_282/g.618 Transcript_282/m.618 type:complete len:201 (-) Transcript_282:1214-1816(-)